MVSCSPATSRDADDAYSIVVDAPTIIFQELTSMIAERSHDKIPAFLRKYDGQRDVVVVFQSLAFMMEYCRYARRKYLYVVHSSGECNTVMLDLSELIAFEKQCCRDGCSRDGAISCSQCKVAVWCSPECLQENFNKHQLACRLGEEQLNELNL